MRLRRAIVPRMLMAVPWLLNASLAAAQENTGDATKLPFRTDGSAEVWRTGFSGIFTAILLLAIVAGALYYWRKRLHLQSGAPNPQAAVRVEWARRVSQRTTLMVVRWHGKEYLLAENGTAISMRGTIARRSLIRESRPRSPARR